MKKGKMNSFRHERADTKNHSQLSIYIQGESKKSGISKTMAITPLKSIRKGKSWCVLENSALMLQDRHQTVQN